MADIMLLSKFLGNFFPTVSCVRQKLFYCQFLFAKYVSKTYELILEYLLTPAATKLSEILK